MINRNYDCVSCPHRNLCTNNNVVRRECAKSIKNQILLLKYDKDRYLSAYRGKLKKLKTMYKMRKK